MTFTMPVLMDHQEPVKDFIVDHPKCGIYLAMGGGKTLSVLTSLATIRPSGHILLVAPINIARSTWIDEIEKWNFPLRTRSLIVNEKDKKLTKAKRLERYQEALTAPPTMYFINQELIHDLIDNMPVVKENGQKTLIWPFPTVIVDESQGVKSPSSRRFKSLKTVSPAILRMIQLTGTPTPQSLLDLWSQVFLLDEGRALGQTFTAFKDTYFKPTMHVNNRPVKWEPLPGAKEEIYARVKHLVMSGENTNIPLPQENIDQIAVRMPLDLMDAYKAFKKEMVLDLIEPDPLKPGTITITADNAAILHSKLIQFASGTMYTGENHAKDYAVIHQEKLEMTDYLIRNNGGSPVIVAYKFQSDREELKRYMAEQGHAAEVFDGSRDMTKRWNAGQIPVLLLQPASAAHGVNLQHGGHTLIWYTLPDSLEHYQQTNARLTRIGQKNSVQIYELITKGTRDERLPQSLARKAGVQNDFLDAMRLDDVFEDMEIILGDLDLSPL